MEHSMKATKQMAVLSIATSIATLALKFTAYLLTDSVGLPIVISMLPRYTLQDYYRTWTKNFSQSYQLKGDYTNQKTEKRGPKP